MKQDKLQNIIESIDIQYNYFSCRVPDIGNNPYYQPFVYFLLKNGAVVYVGITSKPKVRMKVHQTKKDFDSCLLLDFGIKSIRIKQKDYFGRVSIRYYLLQTVLEQYFIQLFKTHCIDNGNLQTFSLDNIMDASIVDGLSSRIRDGRLRSWKTV